MSPGLDISLDDLTQCLKARRILSEYSARMKALRAEYNAFKCSAKPSLIVVSSIAGGLSVKTDGKFGLTPILIDEDSTLTLFVKSPFLHEFLQHNHRSRNDYIHTIHLPRTIRHFIVYFNI